MTLPPKPPRPLLLLLPHLPVIKQPLRMTRQPVPQLTKPPIPQLTKQPVPRETRQPVPQETSHPQPRVINQPQPSVTRSQVQPLQQLLKQEDHAAASVSNATERTALIVMRNRILATLIIAFLITRSHRLARRSAATANRATVGILFISNRRAIPTALSVSWLSDMKSLSWPLSHRIYYLFQPALGLLPPSDLDTRVIHRKRTMIWTWWVPTMMTTTT